jgi:SH3-like domain-containing protein
MFYKPGQTNSCQNHRPIEVRVPKTVDMTVVPGTNIANITPAPVEPRAVDVVGKISVDANIRSGPGMGYTVLGSLTEGSRVEILETQDGWHKIRRMDADKEFAEISTGWVWSNLISY